MVKVVINSSWKKSSERELAFRLAQALKTNTNFCGINAVLIQKSDQTYKVFLKSDGKVEVNVVHDDQAKVSKVVVSAIDDSADEYTINKIWCGQYLLENSTEKFIPYFKQEGEWNKLSVKILNIIWNIYIHW